MRFNWERLIDREWQKDKVKKLKEEKQRRKKIEKERKTNEQEELNILHELMILQKKWSFCMNRWFSKILQNKVMQERIL